jgi:triacylglycerol esterase/lipase EstA (alpha/beta hydrolase family)
MVLVGHSMGGVISRMMIVDSGDRFWLAFSDTPFDEADLDAEQRELVRKVFFFEHLPYVSRVIFIAAPHRGSEWADYRIGRLGSWLVGLPLEMVKATTGLMKTLVIKPLGIGQENAAETAIRNVPTGIDGLSPKNKLYQVLDHIPVRADLPYHTIAGNTEEPDTPGGSDGIVPYGSSHLEGAQSEKIVHSGHSAHNHPLAILEVHRILLLHLQRLRLIEPESDGGGPHGG